MHLEQTRDSDDVLTITMQGPKLCPMTFDSYGKMRDLFESLTVDAGVRAVILTGAPSEVKPGETRPAFCSGGSVDGIIGPLIERDPQAVKEFADLTCDLVRQMRKCAPPIVAAIDGMAAGAGGILALAADYRVASSRAQFAFLFTHVGLSGDDMAAAHLLPQMIGRTHAADWLMSGRTIKPEEALERGFLNEVVEPEQLMETARALAAGLARLPLKGLADTKRGLDMGLEEALQRAAQEQARLMGNPDDKGDFSAFHAAFMAKQRPTFEGAPGPLDPKDPVMKKLLRL